MAQKKKQSTAKDSTFTLPTPTKIKEYLDEYVVGQEEAKKTLSIAVYNHYKRIFYNLHDENEYEAPIEKSCPIILGPTGSGKTLLVKTVARLLDVPYYIQDCTKITASGYVGSDVEDCVGGLLRQCNNDVQMAETGIIVLDELDKISKRDTGPSITRDVSGECVQQSLLKLVEGELIGVQPAGGRKHPEAQLTYVNTSNILFIGCGAFVGLENIVSKRVGGANKIGFDRNEDDNIKITDENMPEYVISDDIKKYGFIPEFVGRFPIITCVNKLTEEDYLRILVEPKNSLVKQYTQLLDLDNCTLTFTDKALKEIASFATKMETGARGLRNIFEIIMRDIMFETPDKSRESIDEYKIVVDDEYVLNKTKHLKKLYEKK